MPVVTRPPDNRLMLPVSPAQLSPPVSGSTPMHSGPPCPASAIYRSPRGLNAIVLEHQHREPLPAGYLSGVTVPAS
jgi:hypothetical protein